MQDAIKLCGDKIIYCDTDSVKTLGDVPIYKLNDKLKAAAQLMGAYADDITLGLLKMMDVIDLL